MIKTPEDLTKFMTTHGVRNVTADTAPAGEQTSYARLVGTGEASHNDIRDTKPLAAKLRRALARLNTKGRVNLRGNEIFVLIPLPSAEGGYGNTRLPDGSFDIPTHVSDGGGPTDIRRQMESRSNALVESLLSGNFQESHADRPAALELMAELKRLTPRNAFIQNIRTESDDDGVWFEVVTQYSTTTYVIYKSAQSGLYIPHELVGNEIDEVSMQDCQSLALAVKAVIADAKRKG